MVVKRMNRNSLANASPVLGALVMEAADRKIRRFFWRSAGSRLYSAMMISEVNDAA
jgi:hypothetical protein